MKIIKKWCNRVFIDGLSGMALGLFATLLVGTIAAQIGGFIGGRTGGYIITVAALAKTLTGAGIGVGVATKLKQSSLVVVSAAVAGMTGAFLGGALYHVPIVMDGFISAVAALLAVRLCPAVRDYVLPSHITAEPAGVMLMEELGFAPLLHGDLRLGEGTGAVALFPILDLAAAIYHDAATFTDIKVEAYEPWAR